jgi:hypothetical protein
MVIQPWLKSVLAISHGGLSQGSHTLPAAEACKGFAREVRIDVRGTFLAKVLYDPFYFKRGKMSRWFCTGETADRVRCSWELILCYRRHSSSVRCFNGTRCRAE